MALNIKDAPTERLAGEVAAMAEESKTQAVRTALQERLDRLVAGRQRTRRADRLAQFLVREAWPQIPDNLRGAEISKAEREAILGYGPEGV